MSKTIFRTAFAPNQKSRKRNVMNSVGLTLHGTSFIATGSMRIDLKSMARRVARVRLPIAAEEPPKEGEFGGKGPFVLPPDHVAAIQVPKGGACCAKCSFVDVENHACKEPNYIAWNGGDPALPPLPLDEICSDWFQAGAAEPEEEEPELTEE
jgi:hypothetical protein